MIKDLFSNAFGWDNRYFVTIRTLVTSPHVLLNEYIDGTRKKYVNPFGFFAIGAAISLLAFNQFSEDYLSIVGEVNKKQMEAMNDVILSDRTNDENVSDNVKVLDHDELLKKQLAQGEKIQKTILKYYNLFSFVLLPFYAIIAFLTFWKPYNYGEHLVINAYIQGLTFLLTTIFFLLGLVFTTTIHFLGLGSTIIYYTYAYTRLYNLSFGQVIVRLLKFVVITAVMIIGLIFLGFIIGVVGSALGQ
ncbi:hypothetical protein GCM10022259_41950 [Aquimarina mytili]